MDQRTLEHPESSPGRTGPARWLWALVASLRFVGFPPLGGSPLFRAIPPSAAFMALLTLGACATPGSRGVAGCRSDLAPHQRSLTEVMDSASLQQGLEGRWTPVDGLVLATVRFDSLGAVRTASVLTVSLPDSSQVALQSLLMASAVPEGPPGEVVSLFLGDPSGPSVRRVSRFQACAPEMSGGRGTRTEIQRHMSGFCRQAGLRQGASGEVLGLVDPRGRVVDARISTSSGSIQFDMEAVRLLGTIPFVPRRVEDIPLETWVTVPFACLPFGAR
jgi:TonB family protein